MQSLWSKKMYKVNEQGILSPVMNELKTFFLYKEI